MGKRIVGVRQRGKRSYSINYRDAAGQRVFETIQADSIEDAVKEREARVGDVARGLQVSSKPNTVLFEELAADVIVDYKHNNYSSWEDVEARFRLHILPVFGRTKAALITTAMLKSYRLARTEEGAKPATINRELESMRHAYYLAKDCTPPKALHMPGFPIVKEKNVRKGFFELRQIQALCEHLPAHLIPPARFAYITGWRRGEVLELRRRHVHFTAGEVRLEPGETKNEDGRTFPMVQELRQLLVAVMPAHGFPNDLVFTGAAGQPIKKFAKSWTTACRKAGLPIRYVPLQRVNPQTGKKESAIYKRGKNKGKPILVCRAAVYFHDFRRTAYRNLVRLGIPESVAMEAVGWKDPKTAARYNITAKADLDVLREKFDASGDKFGDSRSKS